MIEPIPIATVAACIIPPAALPATVAGPARRPSATERLISNSTLGPGITIRTNAAAAKPRRRSEGTITAAYGSPEAAPIEHARVVVLRADDARIAGEAGGSEILVSSLVRDLVESSGEFAFEDPTDAELKGLTGMHRLSAVRWRTG
jgi:hypothetical protein